MDLDPASKQQERCALYPGSFDPMTLGHLDVIRRASLLFDRLIVAIGRSRDKSSLFSDEERISLIRAVCADISNIEVTSFEGLAVEFARKQGVLAMVRGIRSSADYSYEMQMAHMNRALHHRLETVFLPTSPEYSHISSSLAKEVALHGGDMNLLVPALVARSLTKKFRNA